MTLNTGDNRCFNPYKTGFLTVRSLIPHPLAIGSSLVNHLHPILQFCSKVISNPPKSSNFSTDSVIVVSLKITQNPISFATIGVIRFLSIVHLILLSALLYIGGFLNYMHLKSAISSRARAGYIAKNHFVKSRQAFIPGALSPHGAAYPEEQELISRHGPYPFYPFMTRSEFPNKQVSWLQNWEKVLLITEEKYCLIASL